MTGRSKAHLNRKPIIYQRRLNRNQEEMKHESVSFQRRSDLETVLTLVFELCGQFPFLSSASAVRLEVCLVHAASTVHTKGRPRSLRCFEKKAIILTHYLLQWKAFVQPSVSYKCVYLFIPEEQGLGQMVPSHTRRVVINIRILKGW